MELNQCVGSLTALVHSCNSSMSMMRVGAQRAGSALHSLCQLPFGFSLLSNSFPVLAQLLSFDSSLSEF
jgi:hypothetical protein